MATKAEANTSKPPRNWGPPPEHYRTDTDAATPRARPRTVMVTPAGCIPMAAFFRSSRERQMAG